MLSPGDVVDEKYRVVRQLDRGGMGVVYEGVNVRIGRPVAIKVMHASMARDKQLVARFEREARAAAMIKSPHVTDVLDLGKLPNGDRFMVMEFLEGESLSARIRSRGTIPAAEIAPLAVQILEGLEKIHAAGILHRDIKPANIFLVGTESGDFVKILDLGVCKFIGSDEAPAAHGIGAEQMTDIGDLIGTLSYIAPEQLEHGARGLDQRGDIYSVGVILYRAVSGQLPYRVDDHLELLVSMREGKAAPLRDIAPDVDRRFAAIVERAMEWDRGARYQSAAKLKRALVDWIAAQNEVNALLSEFLDVAKPVTITSTRTSLARIAPTSTPSPARARGRNTEPTIDEPPSGTRGRRSRPPAHSISNDPTAKKPGPSGSPKRGSLPDTEIPVDVDLGGDWSDEEETAKPKGSSNPRPHAHTKRLENAPLPAFPLELDEDDGVTLAKKSSKHASPPKQKRGRR